MWVKLVDVKTNNDLLKVARAKADKFEKYDSGQTIGYHN